MNRSNCDGMMHLYTFDLYVCLSQANQQVNHQMHEYYNGAFLSLYINVIYIIKWCIKRTALIIYISLNDALKGMAFLSRTCSSKSLRQVSRMRFPVVRTLIHLCIMHYNNHTNRSFFWVLLSLCLSRACLGKMIGFLYKWRKSGVFRTSRQPTAWCETAETKQKRTNI